MSSSDATTTDGTAESVGGGEAVGIPSLTGAVGGLAAALSQGTTVAREATRLGLELTRIAWGRSDAAPAKGDRRFTDPAWTSNPVFRMIGQSYLASAGAMDRIVAEMGDGRSDARAEQARFAASIVTSAAAPTNFLVTNPAALKRAFDTAGVSLARGARNFARDVRHNGAMPSMIEPGAFEVGRDLAVTPGAVVARDDVAEVLQYAPATDTVLERPVLVVPPPSGGSTSWTCGPGAASSNTPSAAVCRHSCSAGGTRPQSRAAGTWTPTPRRCLRPSTLCGRSPAARMST